MRAPIFDGFTEDDSDEEHNAHSGLVGEGGVQGRHEKTVMNR